MAVSLPNFPTFEVHLDGNTGPRWKKWVTRLERLLTAMNITDKKQKKALMLHFAGPEVDEIFDTLEDPEGEADTDYEAAVGKLTKYFAPQTNIAYEVYNFRQARQNQGESLDSYHVRLRQLAKTCDFTDIDKEMKEHIILSCTSNTLRRRALQDEYSLDKLLKVGRSLEISESQARHLEGRDQAINSVRGRNRSYQMRRNYSSREDKPPTHFSKKNIHTSKQSKEPHQTCRNCGGHFPHKQVCPAKDKDCRACGKRGHFARVCRTNPPKSKPVNAVAQSLDKNRPNDDEADEYEYVYTVNKSPNGPPTCLIEIEGQRLNIMIDTGASVNLIDETTYRKINRHGERRLEKAQRHIYSYGSSVPLPVLGTFITTIKTPDMSTVAKLHVVKGSFGNLLSFVTAKKLNLFQVSVNAVDVPYPECLRQDYKCLFGGIGKVKGRLIKLHIDPQVKPKQQPHRRIPFHVRKDVEKELERLEKLDIIEKVDGPTPWVSPYRGRAKRFGRSENLR
ncbi:Retrovirus-related Pol poly from transposon [Paramuricea clavata]|uniref:Retrovirus-related Pol poly from transposon n=1 Tax=Paramuricea clavata TaxID=317549 RepID=A0A6S7JK05_PARCT|nr:Retrovirus-related Pol poly from transposon [Paramuricea clavata]